MIAGNFGLAGALEAGPERRHSGVALEALVAGPERRHSGVAPEAVPARKRQGVMGGAK